MFHFPGCPLLRLWIHLRVTGHYPSRVPPFGNLRIKAYLQLPEAYRSLSRPSSAISAMASTLRSYSLDLAKLLSDPPKTIERSNKSNSFHCCCFLTLFLCSFQGAIEVFVLSSYGVECETSKRYRNYFRFQEDIQILSDFRRLFTGLPPALLPVEAFYLPIFSDRTDLGSTKFYFKLHFSLERR